MYLQCIDSSLDLLFHAHTHTGFYACLSNSCFSDSPPLCKPVSETISHLLLYVY